MTGKVIQLRSVKGYDASGRTVKVTLSSLALAIEYFTMVYPDPEFAKEARSCIRRVEVGNTVWVTEAMRDTITNNMRLNVAINKCLLG